MKRLVAILMVSVSILFFSMPVFAEVTAATTTGTTTGTTTHDRGAANTRTYATNTYANNWGWVGLLGLIGLAGLRNRSGEREK